MGYLMVRLRVCWYRVSTRLAVTRFAAVCLYIIVLFLIFGVFVEGSGSSGVRGRAGINGADVAGGGDGDVFGWLERGLTHSGGLRAGLNQMREEDPDKFERGRSNIVGETDKVHPVEGTVIKE